ncbi:MAG: multiheme c-type cytochrome [Candidatus Binatia bacterium]
MPRFARPAECASCHPRQYQQWQGSMMAYAEMSPVFNALEAAGNRLTGGAFAADGPDALLCQGCHSPVSVALGEFPPFRESAGRPSRDFAGDVGRHGLSCDFCHQVAHADLEGSLLGDGIANAAFLLEPGRTKFGPFTQPSANFAHASTQSAYLRSAEFCGSCHDVRLPGTDAVTGEPFLRLENAFTEWQRGPYATADNPYGRIVTCQDCHMSAYPYEPPGTYRVDWASTLTSAPQRSVAPHYFTGVDVALIDFPGQDDEGLDTYGLPIGQARRRADLLRAACTLALEAPESVEPGAVLPITVVVTNVGAGHNVPTGFSQERQMWIELTVTDASGIVIYESGTLVDRAHPETGEPEPDGTLDDEDLDNRLGSIDAVTLEADLVPGPDENQRPAANLGLMNFGNEFLRVTASGANEVFAPFLANHMDNSHSLPALEHARVRYDVPVPHRLRGVLQISARLRFRAFPPRFLRAMAQARPDLVSEATVDRNRIVDMAEAHRVAAVSTQ